MTTKTEIVTEERKVSIITEVLCNICGESLHPECAPPGNYEGLVDKTICGGYGSVLGDGISYNFSICEKCLKQKVFPLFQDPPKIDHSDWLGGGVCDEDGNPLDEDNPYWGLVKPPDISEEDEEEPPDKSNTPV